MLGKLEQSVMRLKDLREAAQAAIAELDASRQKWSDDNELLINKMELLKDGVKEFEENIRKQAVIKFEEDGDKNPGVGLGIRVINVYHYDEAEAFEWAKEHTIALKLDVVTLKKIAAATGVPCVKIVKVPTATIATDLNKLMPF